MVPNIPPHPRLVSRLPRHFFTKTFKINDVFYVDDVLFKAILLRLLSQTQGRIFLSITGTADEFLLGCESEFDLTFVSLIPERIFNSDV